MSSVGYDLDTSGGLMPLIRALIKPPDEEPNAQKAKKSQHPYYKRPGKGHNHDSCDACEEGGDLICCDRCPASFHLGCHDPPLEELDIPLGQWLCKECRSAEAERAAGSRASSPPAESDSDKKPRILRNNSQPIKKIEKDNKEKNTEDAKKEEEDNVDEDNQGSESEEDKKSKPEVELTPMEILVKAARIMNPKQFELPREMRVHCPFPGTDKVPNGGKNANTGATLVTVDAWGCVPLPARSCFVCGATCKLAPLLQCDYCPLLFHQDCLDPPLTALPSGRWMCPNHVEQYIDWKLVNSISATERVALWERFSGPVDQHAIKIDFIRHARKSRPPFRMKVPVGVRGRVLVPDMVRHHYARPPPLLPSRREYVRCRNVLKQLRSYGEAEESEDETKHTICMNLSCPMYLTQNGVCRHDADLLEGVAEDDAADDLKAISDVKPSITLLKSNSQDEFSSDSETDDRLEFGIKRRKVMCPDAFADEKRRRDCLEPKPEVELRVMGSEAEDILTLAEEQLKKLDKRLVKLLAWQRLQQVLTGERCAGLWRRAPLSARAEELVVRSIDRARLTRYGFKNVALPSQLLSRADHERITRVVWGAPPAEPDASPPRSPGHSLSDATVRATLCPVQRPAVCGLGDGLGRPVPMRLSRLSVGWGSECDVVLARYGSCRYTSRLHALIFFDEVSRHFELINYSEYGSRVNGALYSCDFTRGAEPAGEAEGEARAAAVRAIANARRRRPHRLNGDLTCSKEDLSCSCASPGARELGGGWEGSAVLQHGALLQFGCLMFVFSITDAPLLTPN